MFWKKKQPKKQPKKQKKRRLDPELAALRAEVIKRREQVAELQLELFDTESALEQFTRQLEARLGDLHTRREQLREQIEAARRAAQQAIYQATWGNRDEPYVDLLEQYRRTWQASDTMPGFEDTLPPDVPLDVDTEAKIKALYRALAKRFHPDLVSDPEDKKWREQIMAEINAAYAARDLSALEKLAEMPDRNPKARPKTREEFIERMTNEIAHLDEVIADLQSKLDQLADSPLAQLRVDAELARVSGGDLIADLIAETKNDITQLEVELSQLS